MKPGFDRGVLVGIALLSSMIVAISVTSSSNTARLQDIAGKVAHSRKVIDSIGAVQTETRRVQADLRAYLVTGFNDWLKPYDEASAQLKWTAARLAELTAADAEQAPRARDASREIESGLAGFDAVAQLRGEPGGHEAVVELSRVRGHRSFVDPLLETLAEMDRVERARLDAHEAVAATAFEAAYFNGVAAAVLGLVAVALFAFVLRQSDRARVAAAVRLAEQRDLLDATLASIGDGVITTDAASRVTFLNAVAERLTGWSIADAAGEPLERVFQIVNESTRAEVENPAVRALKDGTVVGLANHTILIARDGVERPIDDSAAPIRSRGAIGGAVLVFRDISERKRAELELRESERRRRLALDGAELGEWHYDPATGALETDERFRALFGAVADRLEYERALTLIHPDDRARVLDAVGAATRPDDPVPYAVEYRVLHPDGSARWVHAKGRANFAERGLASFDGTLADISDRKNAEAEQGRLHREVEAERNRLAEVFQRAPSFMRVVRGPNHVVERYNDSYLELIGPRAILGRPIREALPELEGQGFFETLDEVYRTGEPYVGRDRQVVLERGGRMEARFLDFVYQPLRDSEGAVSGIILQGIDQTERKRAEAERVHFAAIVESSEDAIISKTLDGTVQTWNAGAERIFGYTAAEMVGRPILVLLPPERIDEEAAILGRLRRGERVDHFETVRLTKDGRRIDISLTISPIRDAAGRAVGASKVARDITDRKRAEEALKDIDRRKDEFIALLAHELRNPLAPIRNGLQVLHRAGADDPPAVKAREMMDRQLAHMVRLIDDLLDISRIGRNKLELRRQRVTLAEVVASAVETAQPALDAAEHALEIALPAEPIELDADLTRLSQVFSNLLTNSAKYTHRGGEIRLAAERNGESVAVSVRDNGIGIPAASLPTIFDMFSQVDRSIERTTGGLGIGLALVKGLAEMHGGKVSAASDGRGSTFTVTLPVLAARAARPAAPPVAAGRAAVYRILVVDDNRDGAESLSMMLGILGNEVRSAHDGLEAVALAEEFRPDVILMDVGMPRMNGYEATRQIRSRPWGDPIVILALTGWGQEGDRTLSREAGCDGHLVKPVGLADLQRTIAEVKAARSER